MSDNAFSALLGKTLTEVRGLEPNSDEVRFVCDDGSAYCMYHVQDCCETVVVNDVVGNVSDIIGSPILMADESDMRSDKLATVKGYVDIRGNSDGTSTWTFYKLATVKGYVDIRWLGESNGYYSERVDFMRVKAPASEEEEL